MTGWSLLITTDRPTDKLDQINQICINESIDDSLLNGILCNCIPSQGILLRGGH